VRRRRIGLTPQALLPCSLTFGRRILTEYALPFTQAPSTLAIHPLAPLYARGGPGGLVAVCSLTLEPMPLKDIPLAEQDTPPPSGATANDEGIGYRMARGTPITWHRYVHRVSKIYSYEPALSNQVVCETSASSSQGQQSSIGRRSRISHGLHTSAWSHFGAGIGDAPYAAAPEARGAGRGSRACDRATTAPSSACFKPRQRIL